MNIRALIEAKALLDAKSFETRTLSDAELFETRRRVIFLGIDHQGNRAGEGHSYALLLEIKLRRLVCEESEEAYNQGVSLIQSSPLLEQVVEACRLFRRAVKLSPRFLNAYANLAHALCTLDNSKEALKVADEGRSCGFFFDLEYNRVRAMRLSGMAPVHYRSEISQLSQAVEQCLCQGEAILERDSAWPDAERFAKGIIKDCHDIGSVADMSDNDLDAMRYYSSVSAAREAIESIKSLVKQI